MEEGEKEPKRVETPPKNYRLAVEEEAVKVKIGDIDEDDMKKVVEEDKKKKLLQKTEESSSKRAQRLF